MAERIRPSGVNAEIRAHMARKGDRQADLAAVLDLSQASVADRLNGRREWRLSELTKVAEWLDVPLATLVEEAPAREAGHAVPRLLAAVALAFVIAAGLPIHAGFTLLVAVFVGWVFVGLFGAELSTWGVPTGTRHLAQRGRRDRTADR